MSEKKEFKVHPIRLFDSAVRIKLVNPMKSFKKILKDLSDGCKEYLFVDESQKTKEEMSEA